MTLDYRLFMHETDLDMSTHRSHPAATRATEAFEVEAIRTWLTLDIEESDNVAFDLLRFRFDTLGESLIDISETADGYVATGETTALRVDTEGELISLEIGEVVAESIEDLSEATILSLAAAKQKIFQARLRVSPQQQGEVLKSFKKNSAVMSVKKKGANAIDIALTGTDVRNVSAIIKKVFDGHGIKLEMAEVIDAVSIEEAKVIEFSADKRKLWFVALECETADKKKLIAAFRKHPTTVTAIAVGAGLQVTLMALSGKKAKEDIRTVLAKAGVTYESVEVEEAGEGSFIRDLALTSEATTSGMVGGFSGSGYKCPECDTAVQEMSGKCEACDYEGSMTANEDVLDESRKSYKFPIYPVEVVVSASDDKNIARLEKAMTHTVSSYESLRVGEHGLDPERYAVLFLFGSPMDASGFAKGLKSDPTYTATVIKSQAVTVNGLAESEDEDMNMTYEELVEAVKVASDFLETAITESYNSGIAPLVKLFGAAKADNDYELALSIADTIAASLGVTEEYEATLIEYKRQRATQRKAQARTKRKPKTGAEKRANKDKKIALRHDPTKRRKLAKKAKKRNRIKKARGISS